MYDEHRVTSEPYRLMPPRKRAGSGDLREALDAARVAGPELSEALDAACGTAPEPADPGGDVSWPTGAPARRRQWPRRLGRMLASVDTWILIATVAGVIVAAAGVVIAYLTVVKPG